MTLFADAFARAGLPVGAVAFASACRDLAVLALNREPDPRRAVGAWLEMTGHQGFRGALLEFLESVAKERATTKSVEDGDHWLSDAQQHRVLSSTDTSTGDERDQTHFDTHRADALSSPVSHPSDSGNHFHHADHQPLVPTSDGPECEGSDQLDVAAHPVYVAPFAPREPTQSQLDAVAKARAISARVMSGIYITERQGSRTPLELITVASLKRRLKSFGSRAAKSAIEYNMLWLVDERASKQAYVPPRAVVGDVFDTTQLLQLQNMARAFANSPMIQLPEELRGGLAA